MKKRKLWIWILGIVIAAGVVAFAAEVNPWVDTSAAVVVGKVVSTDKVGVVRGEYELWRAEVKVEHVVKGETKPGETVWIYYQQNYEEWRDGWHFYYSQVCPGRPQIAVGLKKMFFCEGRDLGDLKNVLFVPAQNWVVEP